MPNLPCFRFSLLLCATTVLAACQGNEQAAPASRIVLVQAASPVATNSGLYTGEIRARHEIDLAFRVGGKIAARLVDNGAEIQAGQALARLDPADLQLAASAAQAQLAGAESELAMARTERERYAELLAKKFVSQGAFDVRNNALNSAQARLDQARAQSRISGNQANYGNLASEFPAIVTAVLAEAGQVVSAGQPVLRIARPEEMEVAIAVPEGKLAEIRAAREISVSLWADPQRKLKGELRELASAADPATRTYAARISLKETSPELRLGMTARVSIADSNNAGVEIPLGAVVDQGKGASVWVASAGKVNPRKVKLGEFTESSAVISEGLQAGELVVIAGISRLVADESVETRIAPKPAEQR